MYLFLLSVSVGKMTGDMKMMKISSAIDDIINKEFNAVEKTMIRDLKRELKCSKNRVKNEISRLLGEQNQTYVGKLEFRNKISETILTGEEIKGEGNTCLEVALTDNNTGHVVDTGPQSSASVEIVVLKREFDACEGDTEFDDNIVGEVEGKNALLAGDVRVNLRRGIGVLQTIKFKHNTIKQNPPVFRLGARVVDSFEGTRVKEAKTEIFTVKDFRSKYYRKHDIPSLSDEVWRLQNIRKGGEVEKRLQAAKVCTVEDFLIQLLKDPQELKRNVNLGDKKWETTVNHARTCSIEERMYRYMNFQQNTGIVFDLLGKGIALFKKGQYAPINMYSEKDKALIDELLSSAFEHWKDIIPLQNKIELQHFISFVTSGGSQYSFQSEHAGVHDKPGPSKMTGDTQLSSSLQGRGEPSVKESSIGDVENVHNHPSCDPHPCTSLVTSVDPLDSVQPERTHLHDKPGPSEMTGDKQLSSSLRGRGETSVKEFSMGDVEIEHNHSSCVPNPHTSLVTSVDPLDSVQPKHIGLHDEPGPSDMTGDKQLSSSLRGRGETSVKEFSMGDVEIEHNHSSCVPNPHTSLVTSVDPLDSVQPKHIGLRDEPGPSDMTGDKQLSSSLRGRGETSVKEFSMGDVEIEHNHSSCVPNPHTSLVTSVDPLDSVQPKHIGLHDEPGPSDMTGDKQLSSSLRGRGETSVKEFSMGDVEIEHNHSSCVPNPHTSLVTSVDPLDSVQPKHIGLHDEPCPIDDVYSSLEMLYPHLSEPSASQLRIGNVNTQQDGPIHSPGFCDQAFDYYNPDFQNDNDYMESDKPH
ncbi:calmodulin-binding protein 60 A [Forsythia ovata]|uniref:Calmodulin-binding protein 60 A n=1 Tax=Forsythia ovata TaxID=205694 RepID=A0ABD1R293_9LAMI